ncbi:M20/M25/M40 family metallo-hydrolase [Dietzia sp. PP-33]|jgi:acetylornithine deacetylase/succinyl-diaminopimelate desuccinylase-like protein|uniref:M20/M25/M40 family metallo-hydrolase n=1 Tax=Dietzia sp. PP-33 TaxID=2957500 RepID=UPI0029A0B5BB|nr:M20/M25/M40 family metallo-hydrolase [Dietzia sp. PP-33]MDX2356123.1 M20/M25/M40 family metallo-hydrolase [Dietzia sp. PP-33]
MSDSTPFATPHPGLAPLADAVGAQLDRARTDLADLVALPSVHGAEPEACAQACELVRVMLGELPVPGLGPDAVEVVETSDGSRAVFAHRPAAPGRPTVLLYSHYDVQPAGDPAEWTTSPWELTERDGRWYGRGAADCKGNLVVHLTALRALAALSEAASGAPGGRGIDDDEAPGSTDPLDGLGIRLVVEGSEETGGGGLDDLVASRPDLVAADAILIVDSGNVSAGVPTLTTSLRGIANLVVVVDTLEAGVHSGQFGGAAPDALGALISILASLRDPETGATTVDGLDFTGRWTGQPYPEGRFRSDAGILDGVDPSSAAPVADLVWSRPAVTVLGVDCPPVEGAIAAVQPRARALVNLRVPPGTDPLEAQELLAAHIERRRPWNARVRVEKETVGHPFSTVPAGGSDPVHDLLSECLAQAYGAAEVAQVGSGGSIPLCTALREAHPGASIALFGVEDPAAAIHSPDESVDPREIERIALAEAAFLQRLR